jgi:hypothetical protein
VHAIIFVALLALAQSFEVASVKADKSETGVDRIKISKGSLIIDNVSMKRCIGMAYGVCSDWGCWFSRGLERTKENWPLINADER